ncbi:hypothetical protein X798_05744 [Onchocerca flexuosa]|uniref:Gnk2-homologous domain-containing protein n=2 Tax=Onchocerca flexuosa TaxID=387005 RepID=A0A183H034_9BILA|nr:hypothetical protein X798_05744 [Onchocerca flexuosa]VDO27294.1 unnamed protein product [Onchocerca flexuosa]
MYEKIIRLTIVNGYSIWTVGGVMISNQFDGSFLRKNCKQCLSAVIQNMYAPKFSGKLEKNIDRQGSSDPNISNLAADD